MSLRTLTTAPQGASEEQSMIRSLARALLALLFACAAASAADSPQLSVTPADGPIDAPLHVVMRNVLPGTRVRIEAARPDARGRTWTAVGEYLADATGTIDVDVAPSLAGSYTGVSPHALWCSALPVAPEHLSEYVASLRQHPELGTSPMLEVSALYTVTVSASIAGKPVATAKATRSYAHGIVPEEVSAAGGVRGRFFPVAAQGTAGVPVVVLAGSGGGLPETQAAPLSRRGSSTTRICPRRCERSRSRAFARARSG
jgi:hypothetical protein